MKQRGIDWYARLSAALVAIMIFEIHLMLFGDPENTQIGVTVYYVTSGLFNASAIFCYSKLSTGKLSLDLQEITFWAISLNALGWCMYMMYISPEITNLITNALTYGTFARLLWINDGDNDVGSGGDLVRRTIDWCKTLHFKEAKS